MGGVALGYPLLQPVTQAIKPEACMLKETPRKNFNL